MAKEMFCFQCEQTAGCSGCAGRAGVCGKTAEVAILQDDLTRALIGLALDTKDKPLTDEMKKLMVDAMFATVTNVNFDGGSIAALTEAVNALRPASARDACAPAGEPLKLWSADEDIRSLKSLILFGLRGMAAYAYHAAQLGCTDDEVSEFFFTGLRVVGDLNAGADELIAAALKVGEVNLKCMALLDKANTGAYGDPAPASVTMTVEKGPFIIVTGHDLHDLKLLLDQTEGSGVSIYTHGEMLPAHAYPELRKYAHLKGNFGTAWQSQQQEFANVPAPILFTTNCLMPPKPDYADRVFTTGPVEWPGAPHIGDDKDFSALIAKAIELGGYDEDRRFTGINGGTQVTTGFGHAAILANAGTIIEAVKSGAIRHFFLVAGCDGARPGRNYYTEFVKQTPADTIVLTLACGKFRFNDMDLGEIGGIPRILDMGQCNDAYGAIKVALALAEAFGCGVNDLPLSMVLSWYEQKAVCILLTLLHLGIKNIRLGPSLPAFVSPNVLRILAENYGIAAITTPEEDLEGVLG